MIYNNVLGVDTFFCGPLEAHGLMTARPQGSLRRIIAAGFIARNCCHKMVTKVFLPLAHEPCLSSHTVHNSLCLH